MQFTLTCIDGETRHAAPFATATAAIRWAEEGHLCAPLDTHDVIVTDDQGVTWDPVDVRCLHNRARYEHENRLVLVEACMNG